MLASSRGLCGGAGFHGRDLRPKSRRCAAVGLRNAPAGAVNPAPTNNFMFWTNRDGRNHPGNRRAGCPHPAGPCGGAPAGGPWPSPTNRDGRPAKRTAAPRYCNLCRGRCLHRPGNLAPPPTPRADMESAPTTPWQTAGQTVWPQPCRQTQGGMPLFFKKTKAPRCPKWAAGRCFIFVLYFSQGFSQALSRAARCAARR